MSDPGSDERKQRIAAAFGRAAQSYDTAAAPQRQAAALVADLAAQRLRPGTGRQPRILEIGCGTGLLTRHIRAAWPDADLTVSDLSPAMVARAADGAMTAGMFLPMDGEHPAFEGPWFDLILSSLSFQWFADLSGALARLTGLLRPGGSLIFSTMGADSFVEWRAAHACIGLSAGMPAYPTLAELRTMMAGQADAFAFDEHWTHDLGGARGFLDHLRTIGATVPAAGRTPLPSRDLRAVMDAFDAVGGQATYHVLFGRVTHVAH